MQAKDLPAIVEIEQQSFATPWSKAAFENELEKSYSCCEVMEVAGRIAGYAITWHVADEVQIANLAVDAAFRRLGVAQQIMNTLIVRAVENNMASIYLEVRKSSIPAIHLYEKMGFRKTGERKNYYQAEGVDAWLMTKQL